MARRRGAAQGAKRARGRREERRYDARSKRGCEEGREEGQRRRGGIADDGREGDGEGRRGAMTRARKDVARRGARKGRGDGEREEGEEAGVHAAIIRRAAQTKGQPEKKAAVH